MNKLNIITGCPRSGTSIMSLCLLDAVGKESLIGDGFPHERKTPEGMPADVLAYYKAQNADKPEDTQGIKDMNPDGFWECRYTVKGIKWHAGMPSLEGKYAKIVSQGVASSNPAYIGKMICMARNPRQVAKSQERLKPEMPMPDGEVVHSPEMFIRVTALLARWIIDNNKAEDVAIVNYDDLISDPEEQLSKVADFLEIPRDKFSPSLVKPSLKRSKPEPIESHLWGTADAIFKALTVADWTGIIAIIERDRNAIRRDNVSTQCERLGERMFYNECANCLHNPNTRASFKKRAEKAGIDWKEKPCMFLCNTAPDMPLVPLKQTIDDNHWRDDLDDFTPPSITERATMAIGTIGRVIAGAANGDKAIARKDIIDDRRSTCQACPLMKGGKCLACSCPINKKIRIAQSECPKNRWDS